MLQLLIKNRIFRNLLETIIPIREEAVLNFVDGGISSRVTDYGNVALVEVEIPSVLPEDFLSDDENTQIGLNIKNLLMYTKLGDSEDNIKLEITDNFKMLIDNFEIDMDIFDPTYMGSVSKIPDEFECKCLVNIEEIRKIARAASQIRSDIIVFEVNNLHEKFTISTESEEESIKVETYVKDILNKKSDHNLKSGYPADFMLSITNTLHNLDIQEMELGFGNEFPIRLSSPLHEVGKVSYYVAPRIID